MISISNMIQNINIKDIKKLAKDPKEFARRLNENPMPFFKYDHLIRGMLSITSLMKDPGFNSVFNKYFSEYLHTSMKNILEKPWYGGSDKIRILIKASPYIYSKSKNEHLKCFYDNINKFHNSAQKVILKEYLRNHQTDEKELINVFKIHSYKLNKDSLDFIIDNIKDGVKNKDIEAILNANKKIMPLKFKSEDLTDDNKRIELLKNIAKTPTSARFLNVPVEFSMSDIKNLAPIMRFNFLSFIYKKKIHYGDLYYTKSYYNLNRVNFNINKWERKNGINKIKIPNLTKEQLAELLFAVGIKKNAQASQFLDRLNTFQDVMKILEEKERTQNKFLGNYW